MSILKTGPYSVDACGDYYDRPVWERDLLVRGGVYGLTDIVPRDEQLARCGSLGYKLTVMDRKLDPVRFQRHSRIGAGSCRIGW